MGPRITPTTQLSNALGSIRLDSRGHGAGGDAGQEQNAAEMYRYPSGVLCMPDDGFAVPGAFFTQEAGTQDFVTPRDAMMESIFSQRTNSSQGAGPSMPGFPTTFAFGPDGLPLMPPAPPRPAGAAKRPEISPRQVPPPPTKRHRALTKPLPFLAPGDACGPPEVTPPGSPSGSQAGPEPASPSLACREPSPDTSDTSGSGTGRLRDPGPAPTSHGGPRPAHAHPPAGDMAPPPPRAAAEASASFRVSGLRGPPGRQIRRMSAAMSPPVLRNAYVSGDLGDSTDLELMLRQVGSSVGLQGFRRRFKQVEVLGKGSFGVVHRVVDRLTGFEYAVKEQLRRVESVALLREQVLEVQAHQAAGAHLNVVRLFSAWVEDSRIFTQMELCEGSLAGSVPRGKGLDARRTMQVYKDVSRALRHLHAMGIAHLDVKPENIYLGRRGQDGADGARECYKLGDFGMATRVPLVPGVPLKDGDARYMSPEQFREGLAHPDRADMWALGASLLEVHTGRALPKTGPEYHRLRNGDVMGVINALLFAGPKLKAVLRGLLDPNPEKRQWVFVKDEAGVGNMGRPAERAGVRAPAAAAVGDEEEDAIEVDTPGKASDHATPSTADDQTPIGAPLVAGSDAAARLAQVAAAVDPSVAAAFLQLAGCAAGTDGQADALRRALESALRQATRAMQRGKRSAGSDAGPGLSSATSPDDDRTGPVAYVLRDVGLERTKRVMPGEGGDATPFPARDLLFREGAPAVTPAGAVARDLSFSGLSDSPFAYMQAQAPEGLGSAVRTFELGGEGSPLET